MIRCNNRKLGLPTGTSRKPTYRPQPHIKRVKLTQALYTDLDVRFHFSDANNNGRGINWMARTTTQGRMLILPPNGMKKSTKV